MDKTLEFLKRHRQKIAVILAAAAGVAAGSLGLVDALQKVLEALK